MSPKTRKPKPKPRVFLWLRTWDLFSVPSLHGQLNEKKEEEDMSGPPQHFVEAGRRIFWSLCWGDFFAGNMTRTEKDSKLLPFKPLHSLSLALVYMSPASRG